MRALILAAGYGERLRPLTDHTPKPLIEIGGRTLLERHLEALARGGFRDVVINTAHLANQIQDFVGDGSRWDLRVRFSYEGSHPLETGGGMYRALALLGPRPFLAVNSDIVTDFDFSTLPQEPVGLAHLIMVDTPDDKVSGDFRLESGGRVSGRDDLGLTFSGIGVYRSALFAGCKPGRFSVVPLLEEAMANQQVSGQHHLGLWQDIGTLERLKAAELHLAGVNRR